MQKFICVGNLTNEPELKELENGKVCNFSIAISRNYKNKDGERITDFFPCVAYNNIAETCAKYLEKGKKVSIVGTLQNNNYEKDGEKRSRTVVIVQEVEFLTPKENAETKQQNKEEVEIPF